MRSFVVCAYSQILRMTSSRRVRWAGDVARMGGRGNGYRILLGTSEGDHLQDIVVDGWWRVWTGFSFFFFFLYMGPCIVNRI